MLNEEKIAAKCIDAVIKALNEIKTKVGFIVVNAASYDKTRQILDNKKKQYKNKLVVINLKNNSGYGGALQEGTKKADKLGFDFVLFMDSDLTNNPRDIHKFTKLASDNIDCVKATRYEKGGKMQGVPQYRQIISKLGNLLARYLLRVNLSDCTNGFRMVKVSMIKNIKFKEKTFAIIMEELYELKIKGAKFANIPVTLTTRTDTKTQFSYSWKTFYNYGKYAIKAALL